MSASVLVVEDEALAAQALARLLRELAPELRQEPPLASVAAALTRLAAPPAPAPPWRPYPSFPRCRRRRSRARPGSRSGCRACDRKRRAQEQKAVDAAVMGQTPARASGRLMLGGGGVDPGEWKAHIDRLKKLFGAEAANVQPNSGSQANQAAFSAVLEPGDTILGMNLAHGGHLTHGAGVNFSGKIYKSVQYGLNPETGLIDYEMLEEQARTHNPQLIICGASAYSRDWDYARIRAIADSVGAFVLCDMSHPAGLIAKGHLSSPFEHCHFVTSTTHKTLRGPRGGIILMKKDFENTLGILDPKGNLKMMSDLVNLAVFPGTQGGPLEHVIAAKAVAFGEALTDEFAVYAKKVIGNANAMAKAFVEKGYKIISGGTDNHMMLIDLRAKDENLTGKMADETLVNCHITINKNTVPFETRSPFVTSGIRIGSSAITSRGMGLAEMPQIVELIDYALMNRDDQSKLNTVKEKVHQLMLGFPLY